LAESRVRRDTDDEREKINEVRATRATWHGGGERRKSLLERLTYERDFKGAAWFKTPVQDKPKERGGKDGEGN
jgi:hypothetical protein